MSFESEWLLLSEENAEFKFFQEALEFEAANERCKEDDATLARISNNATRDFILDELENIADNDEGITSFWIGLQAPENTQIANATRFKFVDGFPDTSFVGVGFAFPWQNNQPKEVTQNCANWIRSADGFDNEWNDLQCTSERPFLCRRELASVVNDENTADDSMGFLKVLFASLFPVLLLGVVVSSIRLRVELRKQKEGIQFLKNREEERGGMKKRHMTACLFVLFAVIGTHVAVLGSLLLQAPAPSSSCRS